MDIKEGNRLIAVFVGDLKSSKSKVSFKRHRTAEELNYDSDWNLLMPVVKKIESFTYPEMYQEAMDGPFFHDCAYMKTFYGNMTRINRYSLHTGATQIEAVWKACIEFIEANKQ